MGTFGQDDPIIIGRVYRGIQKIKFMYDAIVEEINDRGWPIDYSWRERVLLHWEN